MKCFINLPLNYALFCTNMVTFVWLWLVVNDRKFSVRTVFFSHTKPVNSNNPRSYTIVSVPAERADGQSVPVLLLKRWRVYVECAHDALATSSNAMALHVARRMIGASSSTGGEIFFSVLMASLGIT